ncbi:MAG: M1 family peptidase, partial [Candidatus Saccharimonadales bacterium]
IDAKFVNNDPKQGVRVTVANKEPMAFPFTVEVKLKDGATQRVKLPVETWLQNKAITFVIPTTTEAESVTVDPDAALPDMNRKNNTMAVK